MKKIHINIDEKYKKYLPSKKFTYLILSIIGLFVLALIISALFFGKSSFLSDKNKNKLTTQNATINDLLKLDSDSDGVADWEEGLWGTDPNKKITFDEISDAEYIKSKRDGLQTTNGIVPSSNENLSETDKFAQQFFASLAALKQSGQFDADTIKNMSTTLGENIANPMLIDAYSEQDIKINSDDSLISQENYYLKAGNLFETYRNKGVGDELEATSAIAASGSSASSPEMVTKLNTIASAYQEYAKKMVAIAVPKSLSSYHLDIINSSNNTGIAVKNMAKITDDPIIGFSGVAQYQKYSNELIKAVEDLEAILTSSGIIGG